MAAPAAERCGERRADCCGLQRAELRKDSNGFVVGVTHIAHFSDLLWKKALRQMSYAQSQCVPKSMKSHPRENIYRESSIGASPYPINTNGTLDLLRSGAAVRLADTNGPGAVV